jgi:hypothetical protein
MLLLRRDGGIQRSGGRDARVSSAGAASGNLPPWRSARAAQRARDAREVALGQPAQEVRPALPAAIEELRLVDERCSLAHRLRRLLGGSLKVLARERDDVTRQVDVPAALGAQPIQLLALVSLSAIAYEIGVRFINRPRLATLAARDRTSLL